MEYTQRTTAKNKITRIEFIISHVSSFLKIHIPVPQDSLTHDLQNVKSKYNCSACAKMWENNYYFSLQFSIRTIPGIMRT